MKVITPDEPVFRGIGTNANPAGHFAVYDVNFCSAWGIFSPDVSGCGSSSRGTESERHLGFGVALSNG